MSLKTHSFSIFKLEKYISTENTTRQRKKKQKRIQTYIFFFFFCKLTKKSCFLNVKTTLSPKKESCVCKRAY